MSFSVVFIIVIILFLIIKLTKNATYYRRPSSKGKAGEDNVSFILGSLPQDYHVVNDVIIPDQGVGPNENYTTQIDHVVVSPFGIFVIETKNYSGWIFGAEDTKKWKQTFKKTPAQYFYNPIKQNWGHIYALAEHLQLDTRLFKPIVVFSDNCELHVESTTPVVYMSQLKGFILNYTKEIIPRRDIPFICNRLSKINLVEEEVENNHIQSIEERFIEKEMTLREGRCPRCGGILKLRNGKYGPFYGCSNYPRCKFTHNVK